MIFRCVLYNKDHHISRWFITGKQHKNLDDTILNICLYSSSQDVNNMLVKSTLENQISRCFTYVVYSEIKCGSPPRQVMTLLVVMVVAGRGTSRPQVQTQAQTQVQPAQQPRQFVSTFLHC